MSAIADFRIIGTNKLEALKEASEIKTPKGFFKNTVIDNYWEFLEKKSLKLKDFGGSGHIFTNLLVFLQEEKQINLLLSEYDSVANCISERRNVSVIVFTYNHKLKYLKKLASDNFN